MQWRAADTGCRSCHEDGLALEPVGQSEAKGWWPLYFHNVNLADRTLTQLGVEYEDRYVLREGHWQIAESRSHRKSCVIQKVDSDGAVATIAMGEAPGAFGDNDDNRER